MTTVPRWNPQPEKPTADAWDSRFPPGFTPMNEEAYGAPLEKWRAHARMMAAGGQEVPFIAEPLRIERGRTAANAWDANGADWTNNGRLGGIKS